MTKDRPRYLVPKSNRDGTVRHYWQPGKALRTAGWEAQELPSDYAQACAQAIDINKAVDAWRLAGAKKLPTAKPVKDAPARGSVAELIVLYKAGPKIPGQLEAASDPDEADPDSPAFRHRQYDYNSLSPKSKRSYDQALDYIERWLGPIPVKAVDETMVLARIDAIARQVHASGPYKGKRKRAHALHLARIGRVLFGAARLLVKREHPCYVGQDANPFAKLGLGGLEHSGRPWSRPARDFMIAAAKEMGWYSIATAIVLGWWIGQREGDILQVPVNPLHGEALTIKQGKTAVAVHLPIQIVPELVAAVSELQAWQKEHRLYGNRLLIDERRGVLWDEDAFRHAFRDVRLVAAGKARAAGDATLAAEIERVWFMHLRHTAVCELYQAECTVPEIAAITGHTIKSVESILERYGLRTRKLAANAFRKRLEKERQG